MLEVLPAELELSCAQDNSDSGSGISYARRKETMAECTSVVCSTSHCVYTVISLNRVIIVCSFDGMGNEGSEVMGGKALGITGKGCRGEHTTRL